MKKILLVFIVLTRITTFTQAATTSSVPRVQTKEWGPQFSDVAQVFNQVSTDRRRLQTMREKYINQFRHIEQSSNPDYVTLSKNISADTIVYVNGIFKETIDSMRATYGPPPTPFSIFTMGSLARGESGFYTDLEIGILVNKLGPQEQTYFDKFAQLISDRFFLLGEHPDVGGKGLRIDEADNAPGHLTWYARGSSPREITTLEKEGIRAIEGSRIFLTTPADLAFHSLPKSKKTITPLSEQQIEALKKAELNKQVKDPKNKGIPFAIIASRVNKWAEKELTALTRNERAISQGVEVLSRNIKHLYGDPRVFDNYLALREEILRAAPEKPDPIVENRRQEIAVTALRSNLKAIENPKNKHPIAEGILGSTVDVKKQIYRFVEQTLTALGFYYKINDQNIYDIAGILVAKKVMSPAFAQQVRELANYATGLRLKQQAIMHKQGYDVDTTPSAYAQRKNELETELATLTAGLRTQEINLSQTTAAPAINDLRKQIVLLQNRISEINSELKDLAMSIPGTHTAILSSQDIKLLNTKYLPILQRLFEAAKSFANGNKGAFMIAAASTKPIATPTAINQALAQQGTLITKRPAPAPPINAQTKLTQQPLTRPIATPALLPRPTPTTQPPAANNAAADEEARIVALRAIAQKVLSLNPAERKRAIEARAELNEITKNKALKG